MYYCRRQIAQSCQWEGLECDFISIVVQSLSGSRGASWTGRDGPAALYLHHGDAHFAQNKCRRFGMYTYCVYICACMYMYMHVQHTHIGIHTHTIR